MRPKTSVRPPVIAGARRHQLSDLLRKWRRQPRKRSLLLFWAFLSLALMCDTALLVLGSRLPGVSQPTAPPVDRHMPIPYAADAALWEPLRHWVIRSEGRTQLFESFCRKSVRQITGDEHFEGVNPPAVVVSWMLGTAGKSPRWDDYPCLRCEDPELRARLYREGRSPRLPREEQLHGRYVEPSVVRSSAEFRKLLRGIDAKSGAGGNLPLSALERHALELRSRLALFQEICKRGVDGGSPAEMETASAALREAYHSGVKDLFAAALTDFLEASRRALRQDEDAADSRRLACEAWLNEHSPARQAIYLSLLAAVLFTAAALFRTRRPQWRRWLLLSGALACLGCLGWASSATVCWAIRDGGLGVSDGRQAVHWCAALILGVSLCLALFRRDAFLSFTGVVTAGAGFLLAPHWPPAFLEQGPSLPQGAAGDSWLSVQILLLLSACAALVLAWAVAALSMARILISPPTGERVGRLALLCLGPIRLAVVLLTASALVDGCRALELGSAWRGWNAQAAGTLLLLPCCAGLVHARRRGWIQPFALLLSVVFGCTVLALLAYTAVGGDVRNPLAATSLASRGWFYAGGLGNLALAAHAALRYYFGRQPILEV